ncbi:hypothetical protein [Methylobacterium nodulans]|uniref:Uncharacterized protein n=1 Tax=Methylobacterium nodulans (strain LMG 21967 / CNCM I-2342 / ORS 2060) TaxID=460265 RepID=B8IR59_METNO|nr:hypothetical protein [Methylobacterium nodulans]ACL56761.1 conserved hypothetical protein [Methylobacterium nodulans ORS 2060]
MPHFSADILDADPDGAALLREILGPGEPKRCRACTPLPLFAAPPPPPASARPSLGSARAEARSRPPRRHARRHRRSAACPRS